VLESDDAGARPAASIGAVLRGDAVMDPTLLGADGGVADLVPLVG
jgi:hypothetical protein